MFVVYFYFQSCVKVLVFSYQLHLHAMDGAPVTPRTALTTVTITVERNLEAPTFLPDPLTTPQSYVFYVIETRPIGTFIGQVQAQDLDTQVIYFSCSIL